MIIIERRSSMKWYCRWQVSSIDLGPIPLTVFPNHLIEILWKNIFCSNFFPWLLFDWHQCLPYQSWHEQNILVTRALKFEREPKNLQWVLIVMGKLLVKGSPDIKLTKQNTHIKHLLFMQEIDGVLMRPVFAMQIYQIIKERFYPSIN